MLSKNMNVDWSSRGRRRVEAFLINLCFFNRNMCENYVNNSTNIYHNSSQSSSKREVNSVEGLRRGFHVCTYTPGVKFAKERRGHLGGQGYYNPGQKNLTDFSICDGDFEQASPGSPAFQSSIKMQKCSKLDVPSTSETFEDTLGHSFSRSNRSKGVAGLGLAFLDDMILKPRRCGVKQTKYTDNYRCQIAVYMTNHRYDLAKAMTRVKI